jgi:hypothetical protein
VACSTVHRPLLLPWWFQWSRGRKEVIGYVLSWALLRWAQRTNEWSCRFALSQIKPPGDLRWTEKLPRRNFARSAVAILDASTLRAAKEVVYSVAAFLAIPRGRWTGTCSSWSISFKDMCSTGTLLDAALRLTIRALSPLLRGGWNRLSFYCPADDCQKLQVPVAAPANQENHASRSTCL